MGTDEEYDKVETALLKVLDLGWDLADLQVYDEEIQAYQQALVASLMELLMTAGQERVAEFFHRNKERYLPRYEAQVDRIVSEEMATLEPYLEELGEVDNP